MSSYYPAFGSGPVQPCQRCRRPLSPREVQCSNCGYYNTPAQANAPFGQATSSLSSSSPQASSGAKQMGDTPWGQAVAQPVTTNPFGSSPLPQQPFAANTSYSNPNQPSAPNYGSAASQQPFYTQPSSQISMGNVPPQPGMAILQPGDTKRYQPEVFAQPPQKKGGLKIGLIIAIVALLVVLIGGGLFAYISLKKAPSSTPQATPQVVTTVMPKGHPLFTDSFTNNKNGWDTSSKNGEFSVKIGGGSLALEDDNHRLLWELVPTMQHFNDFYLTVDANLSKGSQSNGYGVYIRGSLNQNDEIATYYRFELYGDGTFAIFKGAVDGTGTPKNSTLVNFTPNSAILKQGQTNHLAINAKGSTMTFTVNGQVLATVTDNTYTSGSIALFVSNLPNTSPGAQATFANLLIYPPE